MSGITIFRSVCQARNEKIKWKVNKSIEDYS